MSVSKGRKYRRYSQEFTAEAVGLVVEQGYSIAEAARSLGISANMLGRWKQESEGSAPFGDEKAELARLRKENKRLLMEREIFKKGGGLLRQGVGLRYRFIEPVRKAYPIALLCEVMRVSRSGYYAWRRRSDSIRDNEARRLAPVGRVVVTPVHGDVPVRVRDGEQG